MKEFSKRVIDPNIIKKLEELTGNTSMPQIIFTLAAYLYPKQVLATFDFDRLALEQKIPKYAELMKYAANRYSNSLQFVSSDDDVQNQNEIKHLTSKLMDELTIDFYGHLEGKS